MITEANRRGPVMAEKGEKGADVTQEEVDLAYKFFLGEGEPDPSVRAVLKKVGRGSNGTILKMLKISKATYKEVKTTTLSLPVEIQQVILRAMDKEVTEARAGLEVELTKTRIDLDDMADDNERQAKEIKNYIAAVELLEAKVQQQLGVNSQLEKAVADARQSAEETRQSAEKEIALAREEAEREVDAAKAETDRVRGEAEAARTELAKALLRLEALPRLEKEIDRLQADLKEEQEARHKSSEAAAVALARVEELNIYRSKAESLEKDLESAREGLAKATQEAALATDRNKAHEAVIAEGKAAIARLRDAEEKLALRLEAEQSKRMDAEKELAALRALKELADAKGMPGKDGKATDNESPLNDPPFDKNGKPTKSDK
jgi:chromosome segregation ATPase